MTRLMPGIKWKKFLFAGMILCLWRGSVEAARTYTISQTNPAAGAQLVMGSTVAFTFRITNTANGGNAGERIYEVRFRLPGTGTTFSSTTAAPAGWTRTAYSTTSVSFQPTNWANAIATGTFKDFTIVMVMSSTSADVNETLRDIRARYTTTVGGPPFSRLASITTTNPGSWTLKALNASFQLMDMSNNPITAIQAGNSFKVVITVTNRSTASQSSIVVANPPYTSNRPAATVVPTVTLNSPSPVYSPNPLTLTAGATGTITFTYTTAPGDGGTVYFTAYVQNSGGSATSPTINSATLSVNRLSANLSVSPACAYLGQNMTITMTLTNGWTRDILNIVPVLNPSGGAPVALISGPSSPSTTVTAGGGTLDITWVYQISGGSPGQTFTFSGSASGVEQTTGTPRSTGTPTTSGTLREGGYTMIITPTQTNASSTNEEVTWSFSNQGCAAVSTVSVSFPAGWSWGGDSYSLVENSLGNFIETWTTSGSNPVIFAAPSVAERLVQAGTGQFSLVFTATPVATGASNFTIATTDANGRTDTDTVPITVNAFNFNLMNEANTQTMREEFR